MTGQEVDRHDRQATQLSHLAVSSRRADAARARVVAVPVPSVLAGVHARPFRDELKQNKMRMRARTITKLSVRIAE